jgi:hypothetical protein
MFLLPGQLVNAGSAESSNFAKESVTVADRPYFGVSVCCWVGFRGGGLLWKRLCGSSMVRVGVSELGRDSVVSCSQ